MSEYLVKPTAPRIIWASTGRVDEARAADMEEMPWDESLVKAALHLFLSLLPHDNSLLLQLASVYARANKEIKRVGEQCYLRKSKKFSKSNFLFLL